MANAKKSRIFVAAKPRNKKGFAGYDIVGNIAIVKFARNVKKSEKKKFAEKFLPEHKNISAILEKSDKFKGRLRTQSTSYLAGVKTKEALYKENNCVFRLNVDTCYFSPRLSSERKEIALQVKKGERVLVMFGGVAPFAIVIAKHSKAHEVISVELGKECNKYAIENVKRNKLQNVKIIQGDVRKKVPQIKEKFSRIVMARPNLRDSFLDVAFKKISSKGVINYYGFYGEDEKDKLIEMIKDEALRAKKKINILKIKKAGEVGFRKFRWRIDLKAN